MVEREMIARRDGVMFQVLYPPLKQFLLILSVESLVQRLLKQCMPLGKVLLRLLQNLLYQKFQLPRRLHLTVWLLFFTNLIGKHFIKHIQRQVEATGLQISQISPQTNVLVLIFVCDTFSIRWRMAHHSIMSWQTNQHQGARGAGSFWISALFWCVAQQDSLLGYV